MREIIRRAPLLSYALAAAFFIPVASLKAQYYNTDGGRPGRVEDATPTARRSIDIDFTGIQFERQKGGTTRFRFDPGVSWGVLPRTEIGFRFPFARVKPPESTRNPGASGLAGIAVGGMHALTLETPHTPAIAFASELLLPVGKLAAPQVSYIFKTLVTKRFGFGRVHANAGLGAYSVELGGALSVDSSCVNAETPAESCGQPPIIIDLPCDVVPTNTWSATRLNSPTAFRANRMCMGTAATTSALGATNAQRAAPIIPKSGGLRWFTGVGIDHAFALKSTLISADIVIEKFDGLFAAIDQTLEAGVRHQLTPMAMVDAGVSWRYAGTTQSVSMTLGTTLGFALPLFHRSAPK